MGMQNESQYVREGVKLSQIFERVQGVQYRILFVEKKTIDIGLAPKWCHRRYVPYFVK